MTIRVLVVSQYWDPAQLAGGARSTARAMGALGHETGVWVVAGDRDVGDTQPWPPDVLEVGVDPLRWDERDGVHVLHQCWDRRAGRRVRWAIDQIEPDVIYLPSLFAPGSLAVLWRRAIGGVRTPVVVAPEGELHPGALAHHRARKRAVLALVRGSGLGRRVHWRAADPAEVDQIRTVAGPTARVAVAPDLHGPPPADLASSGHRTRKERGRARIAFVGSIVPKKGLHRALELLWPVRHEIAFDIYGPMVDPDEWARCRAVLDRCEPEVEWRAHGAIPHATVLAELAGADLFILPTLGENYGYVIAEALEAGCPVLTSDQTPWRDLAATGCGWALPLDDPRAWRDRITEVVAWDAEDRLAAGDAARRRADRAREDADADAGAWRELIEGAARPSRRR